MAGHPFQENERQLVWAYQKGNRVKHCLAEGCLLGEEVTAEKKTAYGRAFKLEGCLLLTAF